MVTIRQKGYTVQGKIVIRHKAKMDKVKISHLSVPLCRLKAIIAIEHGDIDNFHWMARQYAANKGISHSSAQRSLLIFAYIWALKQFMVDRVHWIHHNLIAFSFCCTTFTLGVVDCMKKNDAYGNSQERGRAPRQAYNKEKLETHLHEGQTAMALMGDPLDKQDTLFSHLIFIFRLVKGANCRRRKAVSP